MKTVTTISSLPKDNVFRIQNTEDYALIEVTAKDGKDEVSMSFPWAHSIPYMDISVQDAIKKCEETAKNTLKMHLKDREEKELMRVSKMTWTEKIIWALRREIAFFLERINKY